MYRYHFTDFVSRGCTSISGGFNRTHFTADQYGNQTAPGFGLAYDGNVGGLCHGIRSFNGSYQSTAFQSTPGLSVLLWVLPCVISFDWLFYQPQRTSSTTA